MQVNNNIGFLVLDEYAGKMERKYPGFKCCLEPSPWWTCNREPTTHSGLAPTDNPVNRIKKIKNY